MILSNKGKQKMVGIIYQYNHRQRRSELLWKVPTIFLFFFLNLGPLLTRNVHNIY